MGKAAKEASTASGIGGLPQFFRGAVDELKKVHAPTREETIRATIVVFAMVALFAVFLGLADLLVGKIMSSILT